MNKLNKNQINELLQMERDANERIIPELIVIYQTQLIDFVSASRDIVAKRQLEQLSQLAHKLKSSAGNLGLVEPEAICSELERESKSKSAIDYGQKIIELKNESQFGLEELKKYIA